MTQFIMQALLYAYPLWALSAFVMALVCLVTWGFVDHDRKTLLWGIIFLGWSLAFFGAGVLIARLFDPNKLVPWIGGVWIVILPIFWVTVGIECVRLWRVLEKIAALRQAQGQRKKKR